METISIGDVKVFKIVHRTNEGPWIYELVDMEDKEVQQDFFDEKYVAMAVLDKNAFKGLSKIRLQVIRESEDLVTFLMDKYKLPQSSFRHLKAILSCVSVPMHNLGVWQEFKVKFESMVREVLKGNS